MQLGEEGLYLLVEARVLALEGSCVGVGGGLEGGVGLGGRVLLLLGS